MVSTTIIPSQVVRHREAFCNLGSDRILAALSPNVETPNAAAASPAAKRQRTGDGHVGQDTRPAGTAAAQMSLDAAMRAECRTRLYVQPIAWTKRHLELLCLSFGEVEKRQPLGGRHTRDEPKAPGLLPWEASSSLRVMEALVSVNVNVQRFAMADLLRSYGLRPAEYVRTISEIGGGREQSCGFRGRRPAQKIELQFRRQAACRLTADGIWSAKSGGQKIMYINFETISDLRHRWVYGNKGTGTTGGRSSAVLQVKRKKERALEPEDAHQDPYISGLLIALSQEQRGLEQDAQGWTVHLLALPGIRARWLYCYTAWVPARLLERLDEPSREVACPKVAIRIVRIGLVKPQRAARLLWEFLHENELC